MATRFEVVLEQDETAKAWDFAGMTHHAGKDGADRPTVCGP